MAMIEDAYQIRNYANYYVASENLSWIAVRGTSRPYVNYISRIGPSTSARGLATILVEEYAAWLKNVYPSNGYTMSAADLGQMGNLIAAVNGLASVLQSEMSSYASQISAAREVVQKFDSNYPGGSAFIINSLDEYVDLYDFAEKVKTGIPDLTIQNRAQQVMNAVNSYVIPGAEAHGSGTEIYQNLGGSHGVSIFFPKKNWRRSFYSGDNFDFAADTDWGAWGSQANAATAPQSVVGWGPMLVEHVYQTSPSAPDDPNPPELVAPPQPLLSALPDKSLFSISTQGAPSTFFSSEDAAIAPDGTVYVADGGSNRIQYFTSDGTFLGTWGSFGVGDGQFAHPMSVAVAPDGTIYVADTGNDRVQRFTSTGVFLGKWGAAGSANGQFNEPWGLSVASNGTVYVADTSNQRIQRFSASGAFLGKWGSKGSGNGQFEGPTDVAFDASGNVYVADKWNSRIQKFTATGTFITKWGGPGTENGQFREVRGIAVDGAGNIYATDFWGGRIQKFTSTGGFISTWGSFNLPTGIGIDSQGYIYVGEGRGDRIQKFTSQGGLVLKWGTHAAADGEFWEPSGVAVDATGNILVADAWNYRYPAIQFDRSVRKTIRAFLHTARRDRRFLRQHLCG